MTREEFDGLVRRVEEGVGRHPAALHRRVMFLACLGYGGLLAWLVVVALFSVLCYAALRWVYGWEILSALVGLAVLFGGGSAVIKALLVRVTPPEGRPVTRVEAPALFVLLDDLQKRLDSPVFHSVLIDWDCNAAVRQLPRLGVFGWSRNYLNIGLSLLEGLPPIQMRAVLAHEFAHLSRRHGRSSHRLYRLRRSWEDIVKQLSSRPQSANEVSLRRLLVRYFDWFWPRFNAHAMVLSRSNEYQADASAALVAGEADTAGCLLRMELLSRQLEENFWPDLLQVANHEPDPPADAFQRLLSSVRAGPSHDDWGRWTEEALLVTTTNGDTHPCLMERLRALNAKQSDAALQCGDVPGPFAAEVLLGSALSSIRSDVQELWRKQIEQAWHERHDRATSLTHRLTSLEQAVPDTTADVDSKWDKAAVLLGLHDNAGAETLLREILQALPKHVLANLHLGHLLLEAGHAEGEAHLELAMQEDEQVVPQACAWLHEHYRRSGRSEQLRELAIRLDRHEKELAAAAVERREVTAKDTLAGHGLSEMTLRRLREALLAEPEIRRAYLAQKPLQYCPKQKLFVLCVHRFRAWHRLPDHDAEQALVARLSQKLTLPGRLLVFAPSGSFRALAYRLRKLPGAEILRRG
jgi:Zn-dependent protease with chaperone function